MEKIKKNCILNQTNEDIAQWGEEQFVAREVKI
jgi:hypothetical protein